MRYEEFRPDPALSRVIHRYWFLSGAGAGPVTTPQLQPIVPDGRMEIILNLADRFTRHHRDGSIERQARSLVAGQITRCVVVEPGRTIDLVGVRFQPAGAAVVLPVPAAELRDSIIDSTLVTKHLVGDLAGRLHGTPDVADRVSILDQHFLRLRTQIGRAHV